VDSVQQVVGDETPWVISPERIDEVAAGYIPLDLRVGPRVLYDAPVKNVIQLDDRTDEPNGKVLVVCDEVRVRVIPAAGEGV
jgi:hypothetical protein